MAAEINTKHVKDYINIGTIKSINKVRGRDECLHFPKFWKKGIKSTSLGRPICSLEPYRRRPPGQVHTRNGFS